MEPEADISLEHRIRQKGRRADNLCGCKTSRTTSVCRTFTQKEFHEQPALHQKELKSVIGVGQVSLEADVVLSWYHPPRFHMPKRVQNFLSEHGLAEYTNAFHEQGVDYDLLVNLTDGDLRELGVNKLGHRKRILVAAAQIEPDAGDEGSVRKRLLTFMFADLVDSTALSTQISLEDYRAHIRRFQDAAKKTVEQYGGYVAKYYGDGVLAYFGYPKSHEEDADRAIRAGWDLVKLVSDLPRSTEDVSVAARVGIETGPVVVGEVVGEGMAKEHSALGSTPNLAARLQSAAPPNVVVVGPASRRLADGTAHFVSLGPHIMKGFQDPIPVWMVTAIARSRDRLDRQKGGLTPLIGRSQELKALTAALGRMRVGASAAVNVIGEAGIGKSRLVREFYDNFGETFTSLKGQCSPHGGATAFHPFIEMVRQYAAERKREGLSLEDAFAAIGLDRKRHVPYLMLLIRDSNADQSLIDHDLVGRRTLEALVELIVAQGRTYPTVLFLNDLHWADERSASVVDHLIREVDKPGVLVVTCFRPDFDATWLSAPGVENIYLVPLDREQSFMLLRECVVSDEEARGYSRLIDRAGGNPLFLEELARHVLETQQSTEADSHAAIPDTLAGLLMQRVDALSPGARRVAEMASVLGRETEICLLGDSLKTEIDEISGLGILEPSPQNENKVHFHHALVQQAIYESLLSNDRCMLHREAAQRLEKTYAGNHTEIAEILAYHFEAAGDQKETARFAYLAGCKALDLFALRDAEMWFGKCLDLAMEQTGDEATLLLARTVVNQTQVLCWNGDFTAMTQMAKSHLPRIQELGEIEEVSRSLTWIGEGYLHAGRFKEAANSLASGLHIARQLGDESCVGYALGLSLWLDSIVAEGERYSNVLSQADVVQATGEQLGDRYLKTLAYYGRWCHAMQSGKIRDAVNVAGSLFEIGDYDTYPPAECWGACLLAVSHAAARNSNKALHFARAGMESAASGFDRLMSELALGMTHVALGEPEQGLERLSKAPWRSEQIGGFYFAYAGDAAYGTALIQTGRSEEGAKWLEKGITYFEERGNFRAASISRLELLKYNITSRKFLDARRIFQEIQDSAINLEMDGLRSEAIGLVADMEFRAKNLDTANQLIEQAIQICTPLGWLALEQRLNQTALRIKNASDV
ncbi:AAA family ATPase [Sulfitobacter sp. SK011]|uniref:AAA family ATPase n=1 Tax=Sulfitobacter sp. SK011 TaxID=1389004 RepID=UPI0013B42C77|nr:AAA family ATPase [Sulfitobacter sp. SK011]